MPAQPITWMDGKGKGEWTDFMEGKGKWYEAPMQGDVANFLEAPTSELMDMLLSETGGPANRQEGADMSAQPVTPEDDSQATLPLPGDVESQEEDDSQAARLGDGGLMTSGCKKKDSQEEIEEIKGWWAWANAMWATKATERQEDLANARARRSQALGSSRGQQWLGQKRRPGSQRYAMQGQVDKEKYVVWACNDKDDFFHPLSEEGSHARL
jgi:hypothetical protein